MTKLLAQLRFHEGLRLLACALLQRRAQLPAQRVRQRHGHRIADLAMLVVHVAVEAEAVREALRRAGALAFIPLAGGRARTLCAPSSIARALPLLLLWHLTVGEPLP